MFTGRWACNRRGGGLIRGSLRYTAGGRAAALLFGGLTVHCSLPHRAISDNQVLHGPRNSVRCFLTACHAGLLSKVKRDPVSVPFESRIFSASIEL